MPSSSSSSSDPIRYLTPMNTIAERVIPQNPPNWTPSPRFIDLFKGRDDEKVIFKSLLVSKYTASWGGFMAFGDVLLHTQSKTVLSALQRVMYWNVPFVGGGIAYTTMVCVTSSLRGKYDDPTNHFFGGMFAGAVCGGARKSFTFGVLMGLGIGIMGALHKDCVLQGFELWPDLATKNSRRGWSLSHKEDYSMMPEAPGYWVRPDGTGPAAASLEYTYYGPERGLRGPIYPLPSKAKAAAAGGGKAEC